MAEAHLTFLVVLEVLQDRDNFFQQYFDEPTLSFYILRISVVIF